MIEARTALAKSLHSLRRPHLIAELQSELAKVQKMFIWDEGVFEAVLTELARHNGRFATSH